MSNHPATSPDHRRRIATLLLLLASENSQHSLARRAGREHLAFELTRAWFDDVYVPSATYLSGLKGDFSEDAAERFRDCFDPVEIAAMERFHRFFELRIAMVPEDLLSDERIPVDERWEALMRDAGYLLNDLGVNVERLRKRLEQNAWARDGLAGLLSIEE